MATYTAVISEPQRLLIIEAPQALKASRPDRITRDDPDDEYLIPALQAMPEAEKDSPGIIHGLCL